MGEFFIVNFVLILVKDKKKKDKKKKEFLKEFESFLIFGKVCRVEEGKSLFRELLGEGMKMEGFLNGLLDFY